MLNQLADYLEFIWACTMWRCETLYLKFAGVFLSQLSFKSNLTTIGGPWYFWKGICPSKAHKPVTLSGNHTFTKV